MSAAKRFARGTSSSVPTAASLAARAFVAWITRPALGPTWGEAAELYEAEYLPSLSLGSRKVYGCWLRAARRAVIGGRPLVELRLAELRLMHVQSIFRSLSATTPRQAHEVARTVGRVVQYANDAGMWSGPNPARSFRGSPRRRREHPLDVLQLQRLIRALDIEDVGEVRVRLVLRFLVQTGWRLTEARRLLVPAVQLREWESYRYGVADIDTKAGRQTRCISSAAVETFLEALDGRTHGVVFGGRHGAPLCPDTIRKALTRACEVAGIQRRVPHDLRHTFSTLLLRRGAVLEDVSTLVGHRSSQTTLIYSHATIDGVCACLRLFEEVCKA